MGLARTSMATHSLGLCRTFHGEDVPDSSRCTLQVDGSRDRKFSHNSATIEHLRASFARFGLPEVVVTDNGTCFTSSEFQEFTQRNNIRHVRTAPYHPSSNGLAERAVQTFKLGMKKQSTGSLQTKLSRFLFHYRLTPNTTTGIAPAELLLNRRPRSHLDFMAPHSLKDRVQQQKQKCQHDQEQGDLVFVRDFRRQASSPWSPGTIVQSSSGQSYKVKLSIGFRMKSTKVQSRRCLEASPLFSAQNDSTS